MEAFFKNIDALEEKTKVFIQKWKETQAENQQLFEQNRKLEREKEKSETLLSNVLNTDKKDEAFLSDIQKELDIYIERIDACIELLNMKLNGK